VFRDDVGALQGDGHKAKASAVPPQTSGDDSKIFDTENWLSEHGLVEGFGGVLVGYV
jgi:hypothetical protein